MTGPEDDNSSTRPISVAELLARNGTIGAAPPGGRRRRRRGSTDSVTVAELTGEIPIVRPHDEAPDTGRSAAVATDTAETPVEPVTTNGEVEPEAETARATEVEEAPETSEVAEVAEAPETAEADAAVETRDDVAADPDDVYKAAPTTTEDLDDDDYADAVADYTAHVTERDNDADLDFFAPPRRSSYAPRRFSTAAVGAEQMSPDPVDEDELESALDLEPAEVDEAEAAESDTTGTEAGADTEDATAISAIEAQDDRDEPPSYLRSSAGALFGGQTVADDLARGGARPGPEDLDLDDRDEADEVEEVDEADTEKPSAMRSFVRGAWVVGQCVIAVAFGAGLFVAFDQLWKWNNIVALVLSVLVILGLVVGVRVVRKTEDIGSTLIAVAVGALVTLGPLALLQSG